MDIKEATNKGETATNGGFVPYGSEELRAYYELFFPAKLLTDWYSYGDLDYFSRREFAYTSFEEAYSRFNSYSDYKSFRDKVLERAPAKIHVGAVYNVEPSRHSSVPQFTPIEKELVFDIDANDYDDVRICKCKGTPAVCTICWGLLDNAMQIIDTALRQDFGFKRIIWVFSGRRGVHGWICDKEARQLTQQGRSAVASYLAVTTPKQTENRLHPSLHRAYIDVLKPYFLNLVQRHDLMFNEDALKKMYTLMAPDFAKRVAKHFEENSTWNSSDRWQCIEQVTIKSTAAVDIIFYFSYPRLDIQVSKQWNHLLKAPMTVHPSTGMICVPITCSPVTQSITFNPTTVPRINEVTQEVDMLTKDGSDPQSVIRKTRIGPYLEILSKFVAGGVQERRKQKAENQDMSF